MKKTVKPMLAGQYVEEKVKQKLPLYIQPKLDGIRMFIKDGVAYTRSLKPIRAEWLQEKIAQFPNFFEGLDGEIIAGSATADDAYRRTNSSIMSYDKPDDVEFHVFDIITEYVDYAARSRKVATRVDLLHLNGQSWVKRVDTTIVESLEQIERHTQEFMEQGYEGAILRNPDSLYKYGRGTPTECELVKVKKFVDTEAVITGFLELMHNANTLMTNELGYSERSSHKQGLVPMNTLGSITASGKFPDGTPYKVRIGTGFTEQLRKEIWEQRDNYKGKLVKFKHFPSGVKEAPRFPVFIGFRDGDDMNPSEGVEQMEMFS